MDRWLKWCLIGVILLAFFWRLPGLFQHTFHGDEALFASWARHIAVWKDPLLVTQAVDKPPLLFYLQALFYPLQGPVMWAARLPNFIASICLIPVTAVLSWRLYRQPWAALLAALVVLGSPLAIQFSGTAFTDPLLTFWLFCCLALVAGRNGRWSPASYLAWLWLLNIRRSCFCPSWLVWPGCWVIVGEI